MNGGAQSNDNYHTSEIAAWYDADQGLIDKKIFVDPKIYAIEQQRIFARAWHFMCHESHVPNTGDFF